MKYVYICHPLSGDIEGNIEKVKKIVREVCCEETIAFAPVFNDAVTSEREKGISTDLALLRSGKIDELWVFGSNLSKGMMFEINVCVTHNIPVLCKNNTIKADVKEYIQQCEKKKFVQAEPIQLTQ
jgi:hypothetical protein